MCFQIRYTDEVDRRTLEERLRGRRGERQTNLGAVFLRDVGRCAELIHPILGLVGLDALVFNILERGADGYNLEEEIEWCQSAIVVVDVVLTGMKGGISTTPSWAGVRRAYAP